MKKYSLTLAMEKMIDGLSWDHHNDHLKQYDKKLAKSLLEMEGAIRGDSEDFKKAILELFFIFRECFPFSRGSMQHEMIYHCLGTAINIAGAGGNDEEETKKEIQGFIEALAEKGESL